MVFSSATFLFYFLPAVAFAYVFAPHRGRNAVLLVSSLVFYTWGSGALVGILFVSVGVDFVLGLVAGRAYRTGDHRLARLAIIATAVVNIALLAWFKYAGWIVGELADAGVWTGAVPDVTLPIGISFFTFQSMSYTIDVARGRCEPLVNPIDFGMYVTMFPQLVAGPIVRYHEIAPEIGERRVSVADVSDGALRFSHGLMKKVVVADTVAPLADMAFAADDPSTTMAWIGITAYTLQIYFDFSGYSDMAIGLGRMFGFTIPENFRRPYSSTSITDFWRRWHITLSNWFRDYVYIPLGGSRRGDRRTGVNLVAVFLLTGVWHGANWTFVAWGAYHGAWLLIERAMGWRAVDEAGSARAPVVAVARRLSTLLIVMVGWVIFRAPSIEAAVDYLGALVGIGAGADGFGAALTTRMALTMIVAGGVVVALPKDVVAGPAMLNSGRGPALVRAAVMVVGLPAALALVASGSFSPFLYFQF